MNRVGGRKWEKRERGAEQMRKGRGEKEESGRSLRMGNKGKERMAQVRGK